MYVISDNFSKYTSRLLVLVIVLSALAVIFAAPLQTALSLA
jgi:type III secretory pathway component EscS